MVHVGMCYTRNIYIYDLNRALTNKRKRKNISQYTFQDNNRNSYISILTKIIFTMCTCHRNKINCENVKLSESV